MALLQLGVHAPDFALPNQDDRTIRLRDLRGRKVVVWFFSRAFGSN